MNALGFKARTSDLRRARPRGPFALAHQNRYFHGWPARASDPSAIVMAFVVEESWSSALVWIRQPADGAVEGRAVGPDPDAAWTQALACLSLDVDGTDWPAVGERDSQIAMLQKRYRSMRPSLFNSPYEAACHFIIGHRVRMSRARAIRERMAREYGERSAPSNAEAERLTAAWCPFSMWCTVLLHVWMRETNQMPGAAGQT